MMVLLIALTVGCLVALAFHYVGYPALLWVLATLWPRPVRYGTARPSASLIIAAYNEEAVIREKLENSLSLDYPSLQIFVVSDGSTDSTPAIVRAYAGRGVVGLHQSQRRGKAHAIGRAAAHATSDVIVFSDANALYRADAIRKLVRGFSDAEVGCVTGRRVIEGRPAADGAQSTAVGESLYWRYESSVKWLETRVGSTVAVVGEIMAIRRRLLTPLPHGLINDDAYLGLSVLRQGYRVIYEPEAVCWEAPSMSVQDELTRRRRMTAGHYQLVFSMKWWPWNRPSALLMLFSHKVLRHLQPFLMIAALLANVALEAGDVVPVAMQVTLAAQLAFYALATLGLLAEQAGKQWTVPAAAYYIAVGNLGSLSGFFRFVRGGQSVLWQKAAR
jgi:cellulose synthase/poly-beta-1,6-N-acetylglucosamine synthase-like glycosyltransferase